MIRNIHKAKPGSAWDTWQKAGAKWRKETWATSEGALLVAANAFASVESSDIGRDAMKRAFIEGANMAHD